MTSLVPVALSGDVSSTVDIGLVCSDAGSASPLNAILAGTIISPVPRGCSFLGFTVSSFQLDVTAASEASE
jgi:hypothetical protein